MRKWLFVLAVVAAFGVELLAWFAAEDARQAASLNARIQAVYDRRTRLLAREYRLGREGAPREEVLQANREAMEAWSELNALRDEQARRWNSWPARLRREVRRRTGW